jgi:hypothetical protein
LIDNYSKRNKHYVQPFSGKNQDLKITMTLVDKLTGKQHYRFNRQVLLIVREIAPIGSPTWGQPGIRYNQENKMILQDMI